MQLTHVINRVVIGAFLALVLGVVFLQTTSQTTVPAAVVPVNQQQDVCGDQVCTGTETCSSCEQDCGLCTQTFCCNTEKHQCDGPFGVPSMENPCDTAGYAKYLYSFPSGDETQAKQAMDTCVQTCGAGE